MLSADAEHNEQASHAHLSEEERQREDAKPAVWRIQIWHGYLHRQFVISYNHCGGQNSGYDARTQLNMTGLSNAQRAAIRSAQTYRTFQGVGQDSRCDCQRYDDEG